MHDQPADLHLAKVLQESVLTFLRSESSKTLQEYNHQP